MSLLPKRLHPRQFTPIEHNVPNGMIWYDFYCFEHKWGDYPSTCQGQYLTDAIYLSADSIVRWKLPPQITTFECSILQLDISKTPIQSVEINGAQYPPGLFVCIPITNQELIIKTKHQFDQIANLHKINNLLNGSIYVA